VRIASAIVTAAIAAALVVPAAAVAQEATPPAADPAAQPAPDPTPTPTDPGTSTTPTTPTTPTWPVLPPSRLKPPNAHTSWVARLLVTTPVRRQPGAGGKAFKLLQPIAPLGAGPVWLEVRGVKDVRGVRWVKVLLPQRPNGTAGWARADDFAFTQLHSRIEIDLSARRLTLMRSGKRLARFPIAVGAPATPSPTGEFAIAEVIPTGDPKAFLGPLVMPLTAFSNALNEFAGGNGRVAIHGTSLPELIGKPVSHGCIRMRNADIQRLSRIVSPGTHVVIHQ
jgi:lipoprotein-anchoring transpeptidase ErfK/SrfK